MFVFFSVAQAVCFPTSFPNLFQRLYNFSYSLADIFNFLHSIREIVSFFSVAQAVSQHVSQVCFNAFTTFLTTLQIFFNYLQSIREIVSFFLFHKRFSNTFPKFVLMLYNFSCNFAVIFEFSSQHKVNCFVFFCCTSDFPTRSPNLF